MEQRPVCLSVGGSDSCGGAGIQADLRVFEALNIHGCSAITALTAQNPEVITHIQGTSVAQFSAEILAIADFYPIACIKTGMLFDEDHLDALMALLESRLSHVPLIVDPVLIASSGKNLFDSGQAKAAYERLIPRANLWTPNLVEAAYFLDQQGDDPIEMASALLLRYQTPVLLKGGHASDNTLRDIFCDLDGSVEIFSHNKQDLNSHQSHGTGCRLASSIAAFIAHGEGMSTAITHAHRWLQTELMGATQDTAQK